MVMSHKIGLIYNEPIPDRYSKMGEADAIADIFEEVEAVDKALHEMGYNVIKVPLIPPLEMVKEKIYNLDVDAFFNLFEGFAGRPETESIVAGILAVTGKPYTGSSPATLALALDKSKAKELLIGAGIPTPSYQVLTPAMTGQCHLRFPCIVKPVAEDASHGMSQNSVVNSRPALKQQVEKICSDYGGKAMVEEFIDGRECSATIMGNRNPRVLSISEIIYTLPAGMPRLLTFAAKWIPGDVYFEHTMPECPAQIDSELWQQLAGIALKAYRLMGCRGYGRVDFRINDAGQAYVLEINPNPDISPTSGAVHQASAIGLTYTQFVERILKLAFDEE
jgi:D-alanine-D-alanine ligase